MLRRNRYTRTDDQRKDHIDPKIPTKMNRLQQLLTHNMPTDDVENTHSTNEEGDLLLTNKPRIVPLRRERMSQGNQRNWWYTKHWSRYLQGEQNETENVAMASIEYKKSFEGCRFNLNNRWISKNIYYSLTLVPCCDKRNEKNLPLWVKRFGSKSCVGSRVEHETPEEGRRTHRLKHCEYDDEYNSSNTLSDKHNHASSKKFRQSFLSYFLQLNFRVKFSWSNKKSLWGGCHVRFGHYILNCHLCGASEPMQVVLVAPSIKILRCITLAATHLYRTEYVKILNLQYAFDYTECDRNNIHILNFHLCDATEARQVVFIAQSR